MEAILYAAPGELYVLMPAPARPSATLEQTHGPFVACGRIAVADIDHTALGRRVRSDFSCDGHCLLSADDADRLFGADALWGFSDRRKRPRQSHHLRASLCWRRLGSEEIRAERASSW